MTASDTRDRALMLAFALRAPLRDASYAHSLGPTLVVAPDTLAAAQGCGGTIALLARAGIPVRVVCISDDADTGGALYPLGLSERDATSLRLPSGSVPRIGSAGFARAAATFSEVLEHWSFTPQTVILPWRRDPHPDHRAAWEIVTAALCAATPPPRLLEYALALWEHAGGADPLAICEATTWRLDISPTIEHKRHALASHRSPAVPEPDAGTTSSLSLTHHRSPWELFLEPTE